ncbi:MAG TPA: hypothetical protein VK190_11575 [Pseudoneobacillus sp.]|nr:hypothetical protein [Pseudoneobacillus sp.]
MKWRLLFILTLTISLTGARMTLADGNHQHKAPDTSNLGTEEKHNMDGMNMDGDHEMNMDEGHNMDGMNMDGDHEMNMDEGHNMDGMNMDENHDKDSMKDSDEGHSHDMDGMSGDDDMEGMDMGGGTHSHGHGPVIETPPNAKVLGTFGAINASFLVIGLWNKFLRRKGGSNGTSK